MIVVVLGLVLVAVAMLGLLIVIGIHRETPWQTLDATPPTPLAALSRRLIGVHVRKGLRFDSDQSDGQPHTPRLARAEVAGPVVVTLSAAVLLAGLVWGLWRYAGLRLWHAVIAVLFGFYLASTSMATDIDKAVHALASFLSGLHF